MSIKFEFFDENLSGKTIGRSDLLLLLFLGFVNSVMFCFFDTFVLGGAAT